MDIHGKLIRPSFLFSPPNLFRTLVLPVLKKWERCCNLAILFFKGVDFIEEDEEGNLRLSKGRRVKLEQALKSSDNAEQYALVAALSGYFPCSQSKGGFIFLNEGDVWKYGVTSNGEKGRYSNSLKGLNLVFVTQFKGTLTECVKEEKRKIFNYPLLPENIKRDTPLIRPPGNKYDA